jgi:hypothetical protein
MLTAVFDAGYARPTMVDSILDGSLATVTEPMPLETFTMTGLSPITLDCDILSVRGSDLRLIVYTAAPGSPDAQLLALLGAVGLQSFRP